MVELRLDAVEEDGMPKDCFVSVRVGDTQKLSRLAQSRVYRFPQGGDRHYGKIEVFRRIGACNVDVDPSVDGLREVSIDCKDAGFGTLGLKIAVDAESATKDKPAEETAEAAKKDKGQKVKVAKEYLNKHGLEARLSQAMQAVLREKPENPAEYLASRLLGIDEKKLAAMRDGSYKPATEPARPSPPAEEQPPPAKVVAPPEVQVVPFGSAYYPEHFKQIEPEAMSALHAKFPSQRPEPQPKAEPARDEKKFDALREHARQVLLEASETGALSEALAETKALFEEEPQEKPQAEGTKKASPQEQQGQAAVPERKPADSPDELRNMLREVLVQAAADGSLDSALVQASEASPPEAKPMEDLEQLRQLTKDLLLQAAASGELTSALLQVRDDGSEEVSKVALKPSVGTWLQPLPLPFDDEPAPKEAITGLKEEARQALARAAENGDLKKALSDVKGVVPSVPVLPVQPPPSLLPSVGTWLASRQPLTKKKVVKEVSPVTSPDADTRYLPSVGTWMAKSSPLLQASKLQTYKFKPSVGSWLQANPETQEEEEEGRRPVMLPLSMLYGGSFHSTGLRPAMVGV